MITQLDNQSWSKELVTGNAQFIEIGGSVSPPVYGTIYVVSQVRADNTFAVFKSNPAPPLPGPGSSFSITATYTFPVIDGKNNSSFEGLYTDRILLLQEMIQLGLETFITPAIFYDWLKKEKSVLGHTLNFSSLNSERGIQEVIDQLKRIQYGVYT